MAIALQVIVNIIILACNSTYTWDCQFTIVPSKTIQLIKTKESIAYQFYNCELLKLKGREECLENIDLFRAFRSWPYGTSGCI